MNLSAKKLSIIGVVVFILLPLLLANQKYMTSPGFSPKMSDYENIQTCHGYSIAIPSNPNIVDLPSYSYCLGILTQEK